MIGGIVLAGGRSSRMGHPKAWLPLGGETLLQRAVRMLESCASPVFVVAAKDQELPPLPAAVGILRDSLDGEGPLPALALGMAALASTCDSTFALACDTPFLQPSTLELISQSLESAEAAIPECDGRLHPLAAAYRLSALPSLLAAQAAGERSLLRWIDGLNAVRVPVPAAELANINTPADYAAALARLPS